MLFTKFDSTHHEEISPMKKREAVTLEHTGFDDSVLSRTVKHISGYEVPEDSKVDEIIEE